jgi:anti-sigma regulatory factor (Ser/Thr protein kinase)
VRPLAQLPIIERTQAAEARRIAVQISQALGWTRDQSGNIAIVATELANNLVNHAKQGELLISAYGGGAEKSIDLLSVDRGPGMRLPQCMQDGYSTAGTAGTGLGAIRRLSDRFDAYSIPSGTILRAGFGRGIPNVGCVRAPMRGETVCGDSWSIVERNDARWVMMADGLGHGQFAAEASEQAVQIFESSRRDTVAAVVDEIHAGLRSTRGAAVAVAEVRGAIVNYCGLGNINAVLQSAGASVHMVSLNGTAGVQARKTSQFTYKAEPGSMLVMHSDGLQTHWDLDRYPGIFRHHPAIIAGALYRDFSRGRDDVTVLVMSQ